MRTWILTAAALIFSAAGLAQTPVQGRDYVTPLWRGIAVDTQGRIIISGSSPSMGCGLTIMTPCIVGGPVASGTPSAQFPVMMGGFDGANVLNVGVDPNGRLVPSSAGLPNIDGVNNSNNTPTGNGDILHPMYFRNTPYKFNGTTWDRDLKCSGQAAVVFTTGGTPGPIEIVPANATKTIHICHLSFAMDGTADVKIQQGTAACSMNVTDLTGLYYGTSAAVFPFSNESTLDALAVNRGVCLNISTSVNGGGVVKFVYN